MKKIIVPVDFSVHSEYALEAAASIARQQNSELILLHMLDISDQLISKTESTERREVLYFIELAKKRFSDFIDKDYLKGLELTPLIKHYKVFKEVNSTAKELEADLIVMGSRGAEGVKGYFVGSNTAKVVQTADIPVLVVKKREKNFSPKEILFACDFQTENLQAYETVKKFASLFQAKIKLVYVNTPNLNFGSAREIRETMRQFLNTAEIPIRSENIIIYSDYLVETGVLHAAEDYGADMIAIPTHGRKGLDKLLAGSISEDVTNRSDFPVLTVRI